jgi:hypothetical protein
MDFLRSYSVNDLASFPAGTWGIREPADFWEGNPRPSSEFFLGITSSFKRECSEFVFPKYKSWDVPLNLWMSFYYQVIFFNF